MADIINSIGANIKNFYGDNIDNAAKEVFPTIQNMTSYDFIWRQKTAIGSPTNGGVSRIIGMYGDDKYESQILLSYSSKTPIGMRYKYNGVWNDWDRVILNSDFRKHYFSVDYTSKTRDEAIKEIFYQLPNDNDLHFCRLYHGSQHMLLVQKYINDTHGAVLLFGYGCILTHYVIQNSVWRKREFEFIETEI